jgi:hypothetical protein
MGWRYQIPFLVSLGFRVVAPDMMGYGGTVSPSYLTLPSLYPDVDVRRMHPMRSVFMASREQQMILLHW